QRSDVLAYCRSLKEELSQIDVHRLRLRVEIDDRDLRGGEKKWYHVKRGVPLRVEIGPKDLAANAVFVGRRDTGEQTGMSRADFVGSVANLLDQMQSQLKERALAMREANTVTIT
ncbi:MAG: His/Gly/Thr/Pro-type tRNA ligase C-terminal domain-containing protein, partial [Pirellulaceae bacterium]